MRNTRVAKRYAQSLLDAAIEHDTLDAVVASVRLVRAALAESAPLRALLRNPVIAAERKQSILRAIFAERVHPLVEAFLHLVCLKGRENLLDLIADEFIALYNQRAGIVAARAITAVPLPDDLRARVGHVVAQRFGGTPQITYQVEPALLGGLVIECGDVRLDASLAGALARLRKQLLFLNGKQT
ncbi:MAG: ATP synthase subunit delta [Candidatus Kapaibacterium sp.]|nr:MAG: ATP synthase subunit delta [Candidatus Kapabacteria bacterium]